MVVMESLNACRVATKGTTYRIDAAGTTGGQPFDQKASNAAASAGTPRMRIGVVAGGPQR